MAIDAYQALSGIDIQRLRGEQAIHRGKWPGGKFCIAKGLAHGPVQRIEAVLVHCLAIGAAFNQCFH